MQPPFMVRTITGFIKDVAPCLGRLVAGEWIVWDLRRVRCHWGKFASDNIISSMRHFNISFIYRRSYKTFEIGDVVK